MTEIHYVLPTSKAPSEFPGTSEVELADAKITKGPGISEMLGDCEASICKKTENNNGLKIFRFFK